MCKKEIVVLQSPCKLSQGQSQAANIEVSFGRLQLSCLKVVDEQSPGNWLVKRGIMFWKIVFVMPRGGGDAYRSSEKSSTTPSELLL